MRRRPFLLALTAGLLAGVLVAGSGALAQIGDPTIPTLPTTTTTTAPPSSSTSTTTTSTSTTTTTAPPLRSGPTTTASPSLPDPETPTTAVTLPLGSGDGPDVGGPVPADAKSLIDSIQRSPANNTRRHLTALRPLVDLGMTEPEAVQVGFGHFPVGGYATFTHDWLFPRYGGGFHLHEGTDIFAVEGTPVRAPVDGILEQVDTSIGGLCVYVREPTGAYYYLAHLSGFAPGQVSGQSVKQGDTVGFVGTTGDAQGTASHLHFEVHQVATHAVTTGKGKNKVTTVVQDNVPLGTQLPPTDPKGILDRWLDEAVAAAPGLIAAYESRHPRAIVTTGLTRRLADGGGSTFAAPSGPPRSQLMWAAAAGPSGGVLRLVEAEAAAAADEVDYDALVQAEQARIREWEAADTFSKAVVTPLTPAGLRPTLGLAPRPASTFSP